MTLDDFSAALCMQRASLNTFTRFMLGGDQLFVNTSSTDNLFTDGVLANTAYSPALEILGNSARNTFAFLTIINNVPGGVRVTASDDLVLHDVVIAGITGDGVAIDTSARPLLSDIVVDHVTGAAVRLTTVTNSAVVGSFVTGPTGACVISGGSAPGLDATCTPTGASTALRVGIDAATAFIGQVTDDTTNPLDAAGLVTLPQNVNTGLSLAQLDGLLAFDNRYRSWGTAAAFPTVAARTRCRESATPCQIWDHRLQTGSNPLANRAGGDGSPLPTPVAGAPCPAYVAGDVTLTDQRATPSTFLRHAIEIAGDNVGNDNGLCESNEACIIAPNYGAYQGEGALQSGCTFQDGAVRGVTLSWYP